MPDAKIAGMVAEKVARIVYSRLDSIADELARSLEHPEADFCPVRLQLDLDFLLEDGAVALFITPRQERRLPHVELTAYLQQDAEGHAVIVHGDTQVPQAAPPQPAPAPPAMAPHPAQQRPPAPPRSYVPPPPPPPAPPPDYGPEYGQAPEAPMGSSPGSAPASPAVARRLAMDLPAPPLPRPQAPRGPLGPLSGTRPDSPRRRVPRPGQER